MGVGTKLFWPPPRFPRFPALLGHIVVSLWSLLCGHMAPPFASVYLYVPFLLIRTPVISDLGPTLIHYELILTHYILEVLFPNNILF